MKSYQVDATSQNNTKTGNNIQDSKIRMGMRFMKGILLLAIKQKMDSSTVPKSTLGGVKKICMVCIGIVDNPFVLLTILKKDIQSSATSTKTQNYANKHLSHCSPTSCERNLLTCNHSSNKHTRRIVGAERVGVYNKNNIINMETITLNNKEYVAKADMEKVLKGSKVAPTKIQIVVLQRGWVAIGRFSQVKEQCHLTSAYIIRTWGTSNGLGELANEGKKTNTKLDKCADLHFHEMTVVLRMDVVEDKWNSIIE